MANPIINEGLALRPLEQDTYSPSGVSNSYQVVLDVQGDDSLNSAGSRIFPIRAHLPERFNITLSSEWTQPFSRFSMADAAGGMMGKAGGFMAQNGGAVAETMFQALGISTRLRAQTVSVWENTSPLNFSIDMVFNAQENTKTDIQDKHKALLKLAAPSLTGEIVRAPGPGLVGSALGLRIITLYLGNYIRLSPVVITSVSSDVVALMDINGIPISMTISLGLQSFYGCFTTQDIDEMFIN